MTHELEGLDRIPDYYRENMRLYIEDGVRPGGFLFAVLTNDLFGARFHAMGGPAWDMMDSYITFLIHDAPPNCFGSRAKVEAWIEDAAERRAMANAKEAQP